MDNFIIDCSAKGKENLQSLMDVAFSLNAPGKKAVAFQELRLSKKDSYGNVAHEEDPNGVLTFIFLWHESGGGNKLPVKMTSKIATETVWTWLESVEDKDRAEHLGDFDVGESKAFRVFTDFWGHVNRNHYAIIAIQPIWAWSGK